MDSASDLISFDIGRLTDQVASLGPLIMIVMSVLGIMLVALGVYHAANSASSNAGRGGGLTGPFAMIAVGSMLLTGSVLFDIGSTTIDSGGGSQDARASIMSGEAITGVDSDEEVANGLSLEQTTAFAFTVVAVVGMIGFISGWMMLSQIGLGTGSQQASVGKAIILLVGGILAVNIPWTIEMIANSMGLDAEGFFDLIGVI